jgi:hypothetical protein
MKAKSTFQQIDGDKQAKLDIDQRFARVSNSANFWPLQLRKRLDEGHLKWWIRGLLAIKILSFKLQSSLDLRSDHFWQVELWVRALFGRVATNKAKCLKYTSSSRQTCTT